MTKAYEFTPDERQWVDEARSEYQRRLNTVVQIHRLQGTFGPLPDGSGLEAMQVAPTVREEYPKENP